VVTEFSPDEVEPHASSGLAAIPAFFFPPKMVVMKLHYFVSLHTTPY